MGHEHTHGTSAGADRRWLTASLLLLVAFMVAEVIAGVVANSLALIADAGHLLTDAGALLLAVVISRLVTRPARGRYTYGLARLDALSGQANGITLILLAVWFTVEGIRRLVEPSQVHGATVAIVALVGVAVNLVATGLARRADRSSLNVRGVLAHLYSDLYAFGATFTAGLVVLWTGWLQADAVASLVVAALMAWTGTGLVRKAGRVFLEAAPDGVDPDDLGQDLASAEGVSEVHDLHVWVLGSSAAALSAHVLVDPSYDCHAVAATLRDHLSATYGIGHVTLQVDHSDTTEHDANNCADAHGVIHTAPAQSAG
ncbi:MAG: cation diffusion facilitator family transporter [Jatrophihabitans sp.]